MKGRAGAAGVLGLLAVALAVPAGAMDAVRLPFERVVDGAGTIVRGTVTAVVSGRDERGLPATWVTMDVQESLKGTARATLTFKQIGVAAPLPDGAVLRVPGLPHYAVGTEYVVFLRRPSRIGFTSPVGLGQGVYRVDRTRRDPLAIPGAGGERRALGQLLGDVRARMHP